MTRRRTRGDQRLPHEPVSAPWGPVGQIEGMGRLARGALDRRGWRLWSVRILVGLLFGLPTVAVLVSMIVD